MDKVKKEYKAICMLIIILILIDQILKLVIIKTGNISIIDGILNFNITENTKGTYGVNNNSTIMYVLTNFVIIVIAYKFITSQNQFVDKKTKIFLSLIIAGGISNCIDRIFRGYVVEFIQIMKLPIFNIADLCILIGWVSMAAIFAIFTSKELKERKKE